MWNKQATAGSGGVGGASPLGELSAGGNIFVKNLEAYVDTRTLRDTFAPFGTILSCKVPQVHLEPSALNPQPQTPNPKPSTLYPEPQTLNPEPETLNSKPETLNPQPLTLNPRPQTLNPKP